MIKDIWLVVSTLGVILGIGVILILGFAGIVYGFQWFWSLFSFGVAGIGFGVLIIFLTTYLSKKYSGKKTISFDWHSFYELHIAAIIGYLYGCLSIFAAVFWFFTPESVIQSLPSFGTVIYSSLIGGLLFFGIMECCSQATRYLRGNFTGSLVIGGISLFGLFLINIPIWNVSEKIPQNYYLIGKAVFIFILFIQVLFLVFFSIIPALQNKNQKEEEVTKNHQKDQQ